LLIAQCLWLGHFAQEKNFFQGDEACSYLVNGNAGDSYEYYGVPSEGFHAAGEVRGFITVAENDRFDFLAAHDDLIHDTTHPPLYYEALFFVRSLAPGTFSKWQGIGLNLCFFILAQIVLLILSRRVFTGNPVCALLAMLFFGFTGFAVNGIIIIRMYMMASFFIILLFYLFLKLTIWKERGLVLLYYCATLVLGVLTHYYVLVIGGVISLLAVLYFLYNRDWRYIGKFIGAIAGAGIASFAMYPSILENLLANPFFAHSVKAISALESFGGAGVQEKVLSYAQIMGLNLVGTPSMALVIAAAALVAICVIATCKKRMQQGFVFCCAAICVLCYFLLVATITPYIHVRYLLPCAPFAAFLLAGGLVWLCGHIKHSIGNVAVVLGLSLLIVVSNIAAAGAAATWWHGNNTLQGKQGVPIVVIAGGGWSYTTAAIPLAESGSDTYFIWKENLRSLDVEKLEYEIDRCFDYPDKFVIVYTSPAFGGIENVEEYVCAPLAATGNWRVGETQANVLDGDSDHFDTIILTRKVEASPSG
jgi:hypothetical protein